MFNDIAKTYDLANRVLSLGIDVRWRKKACDLVLKNQKNIELIVDVACGTGDMMGHWEKQGLKNRVKIENIVGVDPSVKMMEVGKAKFSQFDFLKAEATKLPFSNESVDIISISYGIRNVLKRKEALEEFYRVLKPNGHVVILEFTKSEKSGLLYSLRDFYMKHILPFIGGIISKNKEAYTYLPNSIDGFLSTKKLCHELEQTGFKMKFCQGFCIDISTLFIAKK